MFIGEWWLLLKLSNCDKAVCTIGRCSFGQVELKGGRGGILPSQQVSSPRPLTKN